jgi:coenzyme PQQ biosynthesis protein PqqD
MTLGPNSVPRHEPSYRLEVLDGEALLFDPANRRLVHCNQTAVLVWRLCDGERSVQEIIALLAEAYPEAVAEMAADVQRVLAQFQEAHAIRL